MKTKAEKQDEKNLEIFNEVAEYFNSHNIMTDTDFNDICDEVERK